MDNWQFIIVQRQFNIAWTIFAIFKKKHLNCPWTIFYSFTNLRERRVNQEVLGGVKFNKKRVFRFLFSEKTWKITILKIIMRENFLYKDFSILIFLRQKIINIKHLFHAQLKNCSLHIHIHYLISLYLKKTILTNITPTQNPLIPNPFPVSLYKNLKWIN